MIKQELRNLRDKVISWHVDNTNVLHAWLNGGSIGDQWLCRKVVEMQIILHSQNTLVIPKYIQSIQHLHADFISRNKVLPDWHLSREVANRLFSIVGIPEIDLMATTSSACIIPPWWTRGLLGWMLSLRTGISSSWLTCSLPQ